MKKQYFYDYKTTTSPVDNSESTLSVEPTTIDVTPESELVHETELGHGEVIGDQQSTMPEPQPVIPEAQTGGFEPLPSEQRRSRLMTPVTAGLLVAVLVLGYLVYRNRPQTYQACANLPGSSISDTFPQTCRTIYGASFQKDSFGSLASDTSGNTFVPTVEPDTQLDTSVTTDGTVAGSTSESAEDTTKGGLPVEDVVPEPTATPAPTVAPTMAPTPAPTSAPVAASNNTVKHRYPRQGFSLLLPTNWSSSNATHDLQTNVTTLSTWDNDRNNPELRVTIQPNWDNTGDAQSQSINAEVAGVSAIKMSGGNETSWYFERDGKVYILKCASHATETCQDIVASMAF